MRERSLRTSLAFCLLFLLPAAPALQALPFDTAETSVESPLGFFSDLLDRLASWLAWDEPQPTRQVVQESETESQPGPTGDNGTCLDPSGAPVPCKP